VQAAHEAACIRARVHVRATSTTISALVAPTRMWAKLSEANSCAD
jgi:hypothetical protein